MKMKLWNLPRNSKKKKKNKIENDDAEYIVSGGSWGKKIIGPSNPGAIPSSSSP